MPETLSPELIDELYRLSIFVFIFTLIVWALYANTIRKTLALIAPENQFIKPNQAWILVIPFINVYWNFEVARKLSYSLNNEFFDRKIEVEENPALKAGLAYAWSFLIYLTPFGLFFPIPVFVTFVIFFVMLIYFISYWYKVNQFRELIIEHNKWKDNQTNN
ncbi:MULTISPECIES: hypothetical protein [Sphingobacterium]|uniref:DUF4328 domain-containing protein n=1 Tax=Sphingobacterium tenebrionis TaxID=3111775 RepID=A0ABU8I0L9_9SPHI|nr:hypothetical protein [Sphingobacterium sp. CZ-2]QBR10661.1 hypothetical protein E3D81_00085 [Sphingobacterium sp. CZ-2]